MTTAPAKKTVAQKTAPAQPSRNSSSPKKKSFLGGSKSYIYLGIVVIVAAVVVSLNYNSWF
jgi:hypothetical protein